MNVQQGHGGWAVARARRELPADALWEIDEGRPEIREPPGGYHAEPSGALFAPLLAFVRGRKLGRVLVGDPGFHLAHAPDVLRAPDVAFVSAARLRRVRDPDAFREVAPDLVGEVLSPNARPAAIRRKVKQYLDLGVRSVRLVDPRARCLQRHGAGEQVRLFTAEADVVEDSTLAGCR